MTSQETVTTPQLESIRKMCVDKGVTKDMLQDHGLKGQCLIGLALDAIKAAATPNMVRYGAQLGPWVKFYKDVLNVTIDPAAIRIPEPVAGFDRLIVVMPGMTPEKLFQLCKARFNGWKWTDTDLDTIVISERTAVDGPYPIWIRDRIEADDELANKSYNDLKAAGINGVTLEERLLDELEYHFRTGSHKDIQNVTLCSGSRYSDGASRAGAGSAATTGLASTGAASAAAVRTSVPVRWFHCRRQLSLLASVLYPFRSHLLGGADGTFSITEIFI